jgi:integrase
MVHLTRTECRDLLSRCDRDLRDLVTGALYSGCRSIELLKMKAFDVGRDGFGVYIAPSKTHTPRFVFLPDEGMAFFVKLAAKKQTNDLLFTTSKGAPWNHHLYRFRRVVKVSRVPNGFTFHGLRHTYASQLVQAGAPLSVVAEQLGHVNTVSVSRTYGHIAPQIREAEVRQRFVSLKTKGSSVPATKEAKRLIARWERRHDSSATASYAKIADLKSLRNIR